MRFLKSTGNEGAVVELNSDVREDSRIGNVRASTVHMSEEPRSRFSGHAEHEVNKEASHLPLPQPLLQPEDHIEFTSPIFHRTYPRVPSPVPNLVSNSLESDKQPSHRDLANSTLAYISRDVSSLNWHRRSKDE